LTAAGGVL
jgi:hypothetical protein